MDYDLIIIGAGPAGYLAAVRAAQMGLHTVVIEKRHLGGMCLNWGCIPSKILLESAKFFRKMGKASIFGIDGIDINHISFNWETAMARVHGIVEKLNRGIKALFDTHGVKVVAGTAHIVSPTSVSVERRLISAPTIFIATGSRPQKKNMPIPDDMILEIDAMFGLKNIPEAIAVVGAGPTAVEMAQLFSMLRKKVSLICPESELLPITDPYLSHFVQNKLLKSDINVFTNATITGTYESGVMVGPSRVVCDRVINGETRKAVTPPSDVKLQVEDGFLKTNECLQTNVPNIFAIGDVNGKRPLAHVASAQAISAVNFLAGVHKPIDYDLYPINIYSDPEIAQIGKSEPQLQAQNVEYKVVKYPLSINGKALAEGNIEGFIRLLCEKRYGEILGVQIVAPHATDMISEANVIMQMEGTVFDMARIIHAHPTNSEIFAEAGLAAIEKDIDLYLV